MIIKGGTRVKFIGREAWDMVKPGAAGTVIREHDVLGDSVAVAWDDFSEGHFCDGLLSLDGPACGWYVEMRDIEILEDSNGKIGTDSAETDATNGTQGTSPSSEGTRTPVSGSADDIEDPGGSV